MTIRVSPNPHQAMQLNFSNTCDTEKIASLFLGARGLTFLFFSAPEHRRACRAVGIPWSARQEAQRALCVADGAERAGRGVQLGDLSGTCHLLHPEHDPALH
jgi:hypothetical protein